VGGPSVRTVAPISLGIDPEATGYENIAVRAAVMGYWPRAIASLAEEIREFSELGDHIHMPVRAYSSGIQEPIVVKLTHYPRSRSWRVWNAPRLVCSP
jgi:ABC-type polysaccharide/polyol phosphate transport system ATPase subunit